jgi:hypothetical protein
MNCEQELQRDLRYEAQFLNEVAKACAARYGLPVDGFVAAVQARLETGQELYGLAFFGMSAAMRAQQPLEEGWDAAAYAVLDAQVSLNDPYAEDADADAWHLFEIAVHGAAIDHHARQLRRRKG